MQISANNYNLQVVRYDCFRLNAVVAVANCINPHQIVPRASKANQTCIALQHVLAGTAAVANCVICHQNCFKSSKISHRDAALHGIS